MGFMTPVMLMGGLLIAVPVILHLIMRQQPQRVEFPPLRLLKMRRESNRRKMQLRHLLLLLLRMLAIGLIALAMARPLVEGSGLLGGQEAPVAAALVFDTSPRMEYRYDNKSRLEIAKENAEWLLAQLPESSQVAIVDSTARQAGFSIDIPAATARLGHLRATPAARPLLTTVDSTLALLEKSELKRREIYIFTDLSQSAWTTTNADSIAAKLKEDKDLAVYVIDVGAKEVRNVSIETLRPSSENLPSGAPLSIEADISRVGPAERRTVELLLAPLGETPQKRAQQEIECQPNETVRVTLRGGSLPIGTHQGLVRLVGEDALPVDDARYFTVEVRPAWPVLVAASDPSNAIFFAGALAPESAAEGGGSRFQCQLTSIDQLSDETFDTYTAICLLDPPPLPPNVWQRLAEYARAGGNVAIFLGRQAQSADALNSPEAQELLPGRLKRVNRQRTWLAPRDANHPMLTKILSDESTLNWRAFPVSAFWELADLADGAHEIIPFANDLPAIVERPVGAGRCLLMTTPLSDPTNDAGREPWNVFTALWAAEPFVILSNEAMLYLVAGEVDHLNYIAGETAVLRGDNEAGATLALLTTPNGNSIRQSVTQPGGRVVVSVTDELGNYRLESGGSEGGWRRGFSVDLPPDATRINPIDKDQLNAVLGDGRYRLAKNRQEIQREVNTGRVGRELSGYVMLLLVAVLAFELLLSNRFYRKPGEPPAK